MTHGLEEAAFAAGFATLAEPFEAGFLAGADFFTGVVFLAVFVAFLLVAMLLGFFCNKHF